MVNVDILHVEKKSNPIKMTTVYIV